MARPSSEEQHSAQETTPFSVVQHSADGQHSSDRQHSSDGQHFSGGKLSKEG